MEMQVSYDNGVGGKPEKKKPHLNLAVGGGGFLLLGGGLAVAAAALVAAFTVIKKRNTRRYDKNEQPTVTDDDNEKREASQGLSFVLQTPPETIVKENSCCTSHEASTVDSCDLVSTHSLVREDKPVPIIIGDGIENPEANNEEILLSDGWSKESHTSSYEESSPPAPDDEPENVIKIDSVKGFQFIGTTAVKKENEAVDAQILAREENLPMLSVVEEEKEEELKRKFAVEENSPMQEMRLSDDSDEESIATGDDILCNEDSSLPVPDGRSLDESENMINNDTGENLQYTETIQVIKEDETFNTDKLVVEEKETEDDSSEEHASETVEEDQQEKLAVDENSATKQVEEEDDGDDGDDSSEEEVTEKEEEEDSSEGTGSSSMESNVEAIWPAEMIDAPSQGLKEMNVNYQNIGDKIAAKARNRDFVDCQSDGKYDSKERGSDNETTDHSRMKLNNIAARELVTVNDLMVHSSKRQVWIWSMIVILLLLLLLIVHRTANLQDLPYRDYVIVP